MILSGAGLSAESGIRTFRDHDGLWENHDVMEVCSTEGWLKDRQHVTRFYNDRRRDLRWTVSITLVRGEDLVKRKPGSLWETYTFRRRLLRKKRVPAKKGGHPFSIDMK